MEKQIYASIDDAFIVSKVREGEHGNFIGRVLKSDNLQDLGKLVWCSLRNLKPITEEEFQQIITNTKKYG